MYSRNNYLIYVRFGREQYVIEFVYRRKNMINIDNSKHRHNPKMNNFQNIFQL